MFLNMTCSNFSGFQLSILKTKLQYARRILQFNLYRNKKRKTAGRKSRPENSLQETDHNKEQDAKKPKVLRLRTYLPSKYSSVHAISSEIIPLIDQKSISSGLWPDQPVTGRASIAATSSSARMKSLKARLETIRSS